MEFKDFVGAMLRRWPAVLLAAVAVFAVTVQVVNRVGPTYEAESSVVLMPPLGNKVISENEYSRGNPLFYLGGLSQSRDILIDRLSDGEVAELVEEAAGEDATFSLDGDPASGAPILVVTGESTTARSALAAAEVVRNAVPAELDALQASLDIPEDARVQSLDLITDDRATVVRKSQIRAALLAAGLLTVTSLLLIALLDGFFLSRRSSRPRHEAASVPVSAAGAPPVPRPVPVPVVTAPRNGQRTTQTNGQLKNAGQAARAQSRRGRQNTANQKARRPSSPSPSTGRGDD